MASTVKLDASSLPGAVAKATREFVKGLDRKQRFDMNKNGLELKAVHVAGAGEAAAKPPPRVAGRLTAHGPADEVSAMAARNPKHIRPWQTDEAEREPPRICPVSGKRMYANEREARAAAVAPDG